MEICVLLWCSWTFGFFYIGQIYCSQLLVAASGVSFCNSTMVRISVLHEQILRHCMNSEYLCSYLSKLKFGRISAKVRIRFKPHSDHAYSRHFLKIEDLILYSEISNITHCFNYHTDLTITIRPNYLCIKLTIFFYHYQTVNDNKKTRIETHERRLLIILFIAK